MKYAIILYSTVEELDIYSINSIYGSNSFHFETVFHKALVEVKEKHKLSFSNKFYLITIERLLAYTGKQPPNIEDFGVANADDIFDAESDVDAKLYFEVKEN